MTDIDKPISPEVLDPTAHSPIAGNWRDDDGQALDSYFTPVTTLPQEYGYGDSEPRETVPVTTRLIGRKLVIGTVNGVLSAPLQVFPADPNRQEIIMQADNNVCLTSERVEPNDFYTLPYGLGTLRFKHTGALWISSASAGPVTVYVLAVTR